MVFPSPFCGLLLIAAFLRNKSGTTDRCWRGQEATKDAPITHRLNVQTRFEFACGWLPRRNMRDLSPKTPAEISNFEFPHPRSIVRVDPTLHR